MHTLSGCSFKCQRGSWCQYWAVVPLAENVDPLAPAERSWQVEAGTAAKPSNDRLGRFNPGRGPKEGCGVGAVAVRTSQAVPAGTSIGVPVPTVPGDSCPSLLLRTRPHQANARPDAEDSGFSLNMERFAAFRSLASLAIVSCPGSGHSLRPSAIITRVGRTKRMNTPDSTTPPIMLTTNGTRNTRSSLRS